MSTAALTVEQLNALGQGRFPGYLGMEITGVEGGAVAARMAVQSHHLAPNGFLHAGSVVTLADTCCGYACRLHLPDGAHNFTTIELKSNHLGTARDGVVTCVAKPAHLGRTTQVWDATVTHAETGKTIAIFRCTQMILYPK